MGLSLEGDGLALPPRFAAFPDLRVNLRDDLRANSCTYPSAVYQFCDGRQIAAGPVKILFIQTHPRDDCEQAGSLPHLRRRESATPALAYRRDRET